MEIFVDVFREFLALVPAVAVAAPLIAVLVNLAKKAGLADGYGGVLSGFLNLVAWVGLAIAARYQVLPEAKTALEAVGQLAPIIVAVFSSALASNAVFRLGRWAGLPGFGKAA